VFSNFPGPKTQRRRICQVDTRRVVRFGILGYLPEAGLHARGQSPLRRRKLVGAQDGFQFDSSARRPTLSNPRTDAFHVVSTTTRTSAGVRGNLPSAYIITSVGGQFLSSCPGRRRGRGTGGMSGGFCGRSPAAFDDLAWRNAAALVRCPVLSTHNSCECFRVSVQRLTTVGPTKPGRHLQHVLPHPGPTLFTAAD